jgi:hypothetical protein
MIERQHRANLSRLMVGRSILFNNLLIQQIINGHITTFFSQKDILAQNSQVLNALPYVKRPGQQEALRIVPLDVMALVIIG